MATLARPSALLQATERVSEDAANLAWTAVTATGGALALIGAADLLLLWIPMSWGNPEWELGTVSVHFDSMPLATIGLGLYAAGVLRRGWVRMARVLATACALAAIAMMTIWLIYLLDVPPMLRAAPPAAQLPFAKAAIKTACFALTYAGLYLWFARSLWRVGRPPRLP